MRRQAVLLPGAVLVLTLSACSTADPVASTPPSLRVDPGVAHVHGLGVDPADGVLYAATHYGLFRLPDKGAPTRVAERFQDTMGFTVVGPRTFLGSGHPDSQKDPDLPPRLGLIRSTDAAQTWQTVSLTGQVDFHVLHQAHGNVYGWDAGSGQLLVSGDDGKTWETRSTLALRDFVVSAVGPSVLLATTADGLLRSQDEGRTWQAVEGAPRLAVLTWPEELTLFGVAPDGRVWRSEDGGLTWQQRGAVGGPPEAAAAVAGSGRAERLFVAVADAGITESSDGGRTFTTTFAP